MPHAHILNGDQLAQRFPETLAGQIIIARECLVEGEVNAPSLEEFYRIRARFIEQPGGASSGDYQRRAITEFDSIRSLPAGSEICLWFEDDLFCQVNLWFVAHLIQSSVDRPEVYLIRPPAHTPYRFSTLSQEELLEVYHKRARLQSLEPFVRLWTSYQTGDTREMLTIAQSVVQEHPFLLPVVQAHIDRIPNADHAGRPAMVLQQIMRDLNTREFNRVFEEFTRREPIYGFGDAQVRRILMSITERE